MSKIKVITAGVLFLLLLTVWGCHSAREIGPEKVTAEESSITITGKVVIFAKGSKSETITLEVIQDNQEATNYTLVGSLGYSLKSKEGEVATVIGHLTEGGFSIVPGPHLWVDKIKEE